MLDPKSDYHFHFPDIFIRNTYFYTVLDEKNQKISENMIYEGTSGLKLTISLYFLVFLRGYVGFYKIQVL